MQKNSLKHSFTLILALFWISVKATSPQYPVAEIPENLLKDADAVVREDIATFKVTSPSQAVFHHKLVITVLKENNPYPFHVIGYNNNKKITNVKARFYDALGKLVRKIEKDEVVDRAAIDDVSLYTDSRIKAIQNSYGILPYTFEVEYEVEYDGIQTYPDWGFQSFNVSVQNSEFTVTMPHSLQLFYKLENAPITTDETTSGKNKQYHWQMTNLPCVKSEVLQPSTDKILPHLMIAPSEFQINKLTGKMSDWKSFGKFLYELNMDKDKLSPEMTKQVQDMTAKATTTREKIDTLYHYLQHNMRYVSVQLGIGGWQTYDAKYVEKNKYGDCKALSNFMKAMLKEAGIKSYLTVVSAGESNYYDPNPNFCIPSFNHMILHIPSENMWLECTSTENPTGYLGAFTSGRNVLLITEEGGQLKKTPSLNPENNNQTTTVNISLNENGAAILKNEAILRGTLQDNWRMLIKQMPKEELKKGFQRSSKIPSFQFNNFETIASDKTPEVSLKYELAVDKYAAKSGTRLFIPINLHNPFDDTPASTDKRMHPIEVSGSGYSESDIVTIDIPKGFEVENIPNKIFDYQSEYGSYNATIENNGNSITFKRQLRILPTYQPAEKFNDFREFYKKIQQADATKVILKRKAL